METTVRTPYDFNRCVVPHKVDELNFVPTQQLKLECTSDGRGNGSSSEGSNCEQRLAGEQFVLPEMKIKVEYSEANLEVQTQPTVELVPTETKIKEEINVLEETQSARYPQQLNCFAYVRLQRLQEFPCYLCQAVFFGKRSLELHLAKNHPDESQPMLRVHLNAHHSCDLANSRPNSDESEGFDGYRDVNKIKKSPIISDKEIVNYKFNNLSRVRSSLPRSEVICKYENGTNDLEDNCAVTSNVETYKFDNESGTNTKCFVCNVRFMNVGLLRKHLIFAHPEERKHKCDCCCKTYYRRKHLLAHVRLAHPESIGKTHNLNKVSKTVSLSFRSYLCQKRRNHMLDHCDKASQRELFVKKLKNLYWGKFKCNICNLSCKRQADFYAHAIDSHFPEDENESISPKRLSNLHCEKENFLCSLCDEVFTSVEYLREHKFAHTDVKFSCEFCLMKYTFFGSLVDHTLKKHQCVLNGIQRERHLRHKVLHLRSHKTPYPSKKFICDSCGKSYACFKSLTSHIRKNHSRVKMNKSCRFKCNVCCQSYESLSDFKKHNVEKHESGKSLNSILVSKPSARNRMKRKRRCDVCNVLFSSGYALFRHKFSHTKANFECNFCGNYFTRPRNFQDHCRVQHGYKNFDGLLKLECSICNQSFQSSKDLFSHTLKSHYPS